MVSAVVAKAFENKALVDSLYESLAHYEAPNGYNKSAGV